jgi:dGTPase
VHELIDLLVSDLLAASKQRLAERAFASPAEALAHAKPQIAPSDEMAPQKMELERLLYQRVYRHPTLLRQRQDAALILEEIFRRYARDPSQLPGQYAAIVERDGAPRAAADFISGMTDRYALEAGRGRESLATGDLGV